MKRLTTTQLEMSTHSRRGQLANRVRSRISPEERGQPCPRVSQDFDRSLRGHGCPRSFLNAPCFGPKRGLLRAQSSRASVPSSAVALLPKVDAHKLQRSLTDL